MGRPKPEYSAVARRNARRTARVCPKGEINQLSGTTVKVDGEDILVMREEDVIGIFEGK